MSAALVLFAWALAGALAGLVYFRAVWATAHLLAGGGQRGRAIALTLARLALLGGFLILAARHGPAALLAAALGILLARFAVVRRFGNPAP
ncbi:MAG: ATP synthase subunit I [Amaricoccus sp.]